MSKIHFQTDSTDPLVCAVVRTLQRSHVRIKAVEDLLIALADDLWEDFTVECFDEYGNVIFNATDLRREYPIPSDEGMEWLDAIKASIA